MAKRKSMRKRVNGTRYRIKVHIGIIFQTVRVKDGLYGHKVDKRTHSFSFLGTDVADQVSETLSAAVAKYEERDRKDKRLQSEVRRAADTVKEVYEDEY